MLRRLSCDQAAQRQAMKAKNKPRSKRVASDAGLEVPDDEVPDGYWNRLVAWIKCAPILEETEEEPPEPLV